MDLAAPVTLCEDFNCKYIFYASATATSTTNALPDAFSVLMAVGQIEAIFLP